MVGRTISHYKILDKIGEGGMGVVYKAEDTRLNRVVAIKVLPEDRLSSTAARQRFEREARTISSLNHPHICTLYDIVSQDGSDFLVMEYVEGKPLKGPMGVGDALRLAGEIADALDHAHRHGVVHRDLKPGNVLVTKAGVKLLDFGLAKQRHELKLGDSAATLTEALTEKGTVFGTYQYMSPEQWEGKEADTRSDVFALGAVLYELLTGKKAFEGKTPASVIAAIMERDPPPVFTVQATTPPALDHVVKRCLAKDPDQRWQSAADLKHELEWVAEGGETRAAGPAPQQRWPMVALVAALFVAIGFIVVLLLGQPEQVVEAPLRKFTIVPPEGVQWAAISPDGKHIAYTSGSTVPTLWIQDLDRHEPRAVEGTEGASYPFWSPDSQFIGFGVGAELKKVSIHGGAAVDVCKRPAGRLRGGTWGAEGTIVFSSGNPSRLYEVPTRGGSPKPLIEPNNSEQDLDFEFPHFLPGERDSRRLMFTLGSQPRREIAVQELSTGRREVVTRGTGGVYSPTGHIVYQTMDSGETWALPFSPDTLRPEGEAFPLATRGNSSSLANDGTLVYLDAPAVRQMQLTWRDRNGKSVQVVGQSQEKILHVALSPDGRRVAVSGIENGNRDIWVHEITRPMKTRLTFDPNIQLRPIWSPSGDQIIFNSGVSTANLDILQKASDGTGEATALLATAAAEAASDWSRDGRYILYGLRGEGTGIDIWYLCRKEGGESYEAVPSSALARIDPPLLTRNDPGRL